MQSDVSGVESLETLQEISVVEEAVIIIGEVVQNASSEGVKCLHTFEQKHNCRDEEIIVGEAVQALPIENTLEKKFEEEEK